MGLDAVEMIMCWEDAFGIEITDKEAFALRTPKMAIALISAKIGAIDSGVGVCPGMRVYHRVRKAFQDVVGLHRHQIQIDSKLLNILPKKQRQKIWKDICSHLGLPKLPTFSFGVGVIFAPVTVRDLVDWTVACYPCHFISSDERWTGSQVRSVVRASIRDIVGVSDFKDDDDFIRDIGIS